jgi:hypothetical protein
MRLIKPNPAIGPLARRPRMHDRFAKHQ